MKRRLMLGFVVFVLLVTPAMVLIWTLITPVYRATAEVGIWPVVPRLVFQTEDNGPIPHYESFVNTQISIIQAPTVLRRVLDEGEVRETRWYRDVCRCSRERLSTDPNPVMDRLKDGLSVRHRPQTAIIEIAFVDSDAEDAEVIVDAVLEEYIILLRERSGRVRSDLYERLTEQYQLLAHKMQGHQQICDRLQRDLGTKAPQELLTSKRLRLEAIETRLCELRQSISMLEWEIEQAQSEDSNEVRLASETQPKYHEDAEWRQLDVNVRTLEHEMGKSRLDAEHPEMVEAREDLAFARKLRQLRESQLNEQWHDRLRKGGGMSLVVDDSNRPVYSDPVKSLEHQLARSRLQERLLTEERDNQKAEFEEAMQTAAFVERETRELEHERELFEAVRKRVTERSMERRAPSPVEILTRAFSPSKPYRDRRVLFAAIALVVALVLGSGVAFLMRKTRPVPRPEPVG